MIELRNLPFPPTMNHRYIPRMGRLILSPDHRSYKNLLDQHLHEKYLFMDASKIRGPFKVEIEYMGPYDEWFTKKGEIKKKDCDNRHKQLIDGVFSFLEIDDSHIFEIVLKKSIGGRELVANVKITF